MLLRQSLKQTLTQRIDPKIILANNILACSTMELTETIVQELQDNPALERPEDDLCASCVMPRELCSDCPYRATDSTAAASAVESEALWKQWETADLSLFDDSSGEDHDWDPMANLWTEKTLHDHLLEQLRSVAEGEPYRLGEYLVGCISTSGYFEANLEELAKPLETTPEALQSALELIQSLEPSGVAARNLQECLRLQLQHVEQTSEAAALALRMVNDFWQDTAARKVGKLAFHLRSTKARVEEALNFIRDHLTPYPGEGFRAPWDAANATSSSVQPDIVVRRSVAGYEIEIVSTEHQALSISAKYREAYSSIRNGGARKYSTEERHHITQYTERADMFIRSILQRRKTLKGITKWVVEYQQGFVETAQRPFLRPLTRAQVAKALELHESTISRATSNKWLQLPSEEVVSFETFFDTSLGIKDLITEFIANEDKRNPLSDQELADMLQERGWDVARRTVVKYREALNILSSRRRKTG